MSHAAVRARCSGILALQPETDGGLRKCGPHVQSARYLSGAVRTKGSEVLATGVAWPTAASLARLADSGQPKQLLPKKRSVGSAGS